MAYLELKNVHKTFGNVKAVSDFTLDIEKGTLVSFLGPSGCGKTTTLRMIAGFEQPDEGSILLDNEDITQVSPNQRDIGMVFQAYALFPNMSVRQNIAFGLKMKKTPKAEIEKRVDEVLELVRLKDTAKRYPHQLSGGQQQRIALARALAVRPRVLLLDEPLSALDAEVRVALRGEIRHIQSELAITTVYHPRSGRSSFHFRSSSGDGKWDHPASGNTSGNLPRTADSLCGYLYWNCQPILRESGRGIWRTKQRIDHFNQKIIRFHGRTERGGAGAPRIDYSKWYSTVCKYGKYHSRHCGNYYLSRRGHPVGSTCEPAACGGRYHHELIRIHLPESGGVVVIQAGCM